MEANNAAPVADDVAACGAEPAARGRTLDMAAEIIRSKALVCSLVNGSCCCCCCYCGSGGRSVVEIPAWFRRASTSYPLSFVLALHGEVSFSCFHSRRFSYCYSLPLIVPSYCPLVVAISLCMPLSIVVGC